MIGKKLIILYGSQTGTSEDVAERIAREGLYRKLNVYLSSLDDFNLEEFYNSNPNNEAETICCFVCSTTGQGEEPKNMKKFWYFIRKKSCPSDLFSGVKFAVLGLGDSSYAKFNFIGKKVYKRIEQLGGVPFLPVGLADDQHDLGPDAVIDPWLINFWQNAFPSLSQYKTDYDEKDLCEPKFVIDTSLVESNENITSQEFLLEERRLVENKRVTSEFHFQDVRLFSFDLKESSLSTFSPGDVLMVQPSNLQENIELFLSLFPDINNRRKEQFHLKPNSKTPWAKIPQEILKTHPFPWTWEDCVKFYLDIQSIPKRYFFQLLAHFTDNELEKEKLIEFTTAEGQQDLYSYCNRPKRNILEILQDFPHATKNIRPEYLFDLIPAIKPREFSIASSLKAHPDILQILVAIVEYKTKLKKPRMGLCTNWLLNLNIGDKVPIWIEKGSFQFPSIEKDIPVIMIGPGTGCAPFRSFISERFDSNNELILYFGCRYEAKDYFFKTEWTQLKEKNKLKLFLAFSRDREDLDNRRNYVQHKIEESSKLLWDLIENKKGSIFLAGNAKRMPIDVSDAFKTIFQKHGISDSENYFNNLIKTNRYQTEVWS